ncbi:MAG: hypothetical protein C0621_11185 [Desulfuromonas sp.]|nr:MAG: hypothetical protein C0621_11185 [Desulfuromonas sp.]
MRQLFGLLLICCVFSACSKEAEQKQAQAPSVSEPAISSSGELSVQLVPSEPTRTSRIKAMVSSSRGAALDLIWRVNGQKVETQGTLLAPGVFVKGDVITVEVNSEGERVESSVVVRNTPPRIIRAEFESTAVQTGRDIKIIPEAVDEDGDDLSFSYLWIVNGEELSWIDGSVLSAERFKKGDEIDVVITPHDGESAGETFSGAAFQIPNAPPYFVSVPATSFKANTYTYRVEARDPEGDPIAYSLEAAPAGMTIDSSSGMVRWEIGQNQAGEQPVRIVATDSDGVRAVQEYVLTISYQ